MRGSERRLRISTGEELVCARRGATHSISLPLERDMRNRIRCKVPSKAAACGAGVSLGGVPGYAAMACETTDLLATIYETDPLRSPSPTMQQSRATSSPVPNTFPPGMLQPAATDTYRGANIHIGQWGKRFKTGGVPDSLFLDYGPRSERQFKAGCFTVSLSLRFRKQV